MNIKLTEVRGIYLAVLAFGLAACAGESQDNTAFPADNIVNVIVEAVQFNNERTRIEAVGTSRALQSVTLTPVASGEVVAVNFVSGQRVENGGILVELDSRDQVLSVDLAKIRLEDAERLYERYRQTGGSGAVLPTTIDAARTALESARVEYNQARNALEDRVIKAPFAGHIGMSQIDRGDRVTPGTVITTLDDRDILLVSFEVPEILIGTLRTGSQVAVNTWTGGASVAFGEVVDIGSRIDPLTRTFTVRASVANKGDELRPGMSFRVSLDIKGSLYPIVPEIAVQWGNDGSYVWAVEGNLVHRVPARIVQRQEGRVLLDANLVEGDLVVVEGIQRMYEGLKVQYTIRANIDYQEVSRDIKVES